MYGSAGYERIPNFGFYKDAERLRLLRPHPLTCGRRAPPACRSGDPAAPRAGRRPLTVPRTRQSRRTLGSAG